MPNDRPSGAKKNLAVTTPVTEWKKPVRSEILDEVDGFITELPSGNRIKMARSMDMPTMLASGRIPNPLAGVVQRMIDNRDRTGLPLDAKTDPKIQMQLLGVIQETVIACVIEPPIAGPPGRGRMKNEQGDFIEEDADAYHERINQWECPDGHVSIFDVSMEDQAYIFAVAQGAAADLAQFRQVSKRSVADVSGVEGVRKPTKRTGGSGSKKKK